MRLACGMDPDVVLHGLEPADIFNREEQHSSARFEDHASGVVLLARILQIANTGNSVRCWALSSALNGGTQSFHRERLEQIIECMKLESAHCPSIIRCYEDDLR